MIVMGIIGESKKDKIGTLLMRPKGLLPMVWAYLI
jgi:hypothetical protein